MIHPTLGFAGNLLTNGTFDTGVGVWGNVCNHWSPVDADASPSSGSLLSSFAVNDPCAQFAVANQTVVITPKTTYALSAKVLNGSAGVVTTILINFYDSFGKDAGGKAFFTISTVGTWTLGRVVATAPVNAVTALITLQRNSAAGDVRFDDVILDIAPPDSNGGLLVNGTFDIGVGIWGNGCNTWSPVDANGSFNSGSLLSSFAMNDPCAKYAVANQTVVITPKTTYVLSAKVLNGSKDIVTTILMNFYDSSGNDAGGEAYFMISTIGTWTQGRAVATAPPNAHTALITLQRNSAAGDVRFDDVILNVAPPPTSSGLLQGGTFDQGVGIWGNVCNSWSPIDADGSFNSGSLLSSFKANDSCAAYAVANQQVGVTPGGLYELTAKVLNGSVGIVSYVIIDFYDSSGVFDGVRSYVSVASAGEWTSTRQVITAPPDAKSVLVTLQRNEVAGDVRFDDVVLVSAGQKPVIQSFSIAPSLTPGSAILTWTGSGATFASIDNGVGGVSPSSGARSVHPTTTTTYTLTVRSDAGVDNRAVTVVVNNSQTPTVSTLSGSGTTGAVDGTALTSTFTHPFAVAALPQSNGPAKDAPYAATVRDLFVLDSNHTIRRVSPDGTTETWAGKPGVAGRTNGFRTSATFDFSNYTGAIVANADGTIDVVDANGIQRHIDTAGIVTNACTSCARFPLPAGLVRLPDKTTLISDAGNDTITRVSPSGTIIVIGRASEPGFRDGTADQARFSQPRGMSVDDSGNVYVLDTGNNAIRKINPRNVVSTLTKAVPSETGKGDLVLGCCASGIAPAPGGGVFVTDPGSNTVKQIASDGSITTVAGSGSNGSGNGSGSAASFNNPLGVTIMPDGTLVVADTSNNKIRVVQPAQSASRKRSVKH